MTPESAPPMVDSASGRRIPSLDGMRGIGIILVFTTHTVLGSGSPNARFTTALHHFGFAGVTMFLVVSGFLISLILFKEYARTGSISLRKFYTRRIIRLWPALYVVVGVTALLGALGYLKVNAVNIISPLVFLTNYLNQDGNTALAHTWSLALEEQFYLVWPIAILLIGRRHLVRTLIILVALAPFVRVASYFLLPGLRAGALYQFHNRYDAMALGALLALLWGHPRVQKFLKSPGKWPWVAVVALFVPVVGEQIGGERFMLVAGYSIQSMSLVVLIALAVEHHQSIWGRILNYRVVVALGLMSYSLYLWQQMFLLQPFGWFKFWPLGMVTAVVVGTASYYLLEKPFIKMRSSTVPRRHRRRRAQKLQAAVVVGAGAEPEKR